MAIYLGEKKLKNIIYNNRFTSLIKLGENNLLNYEETQTADDVKDNIVNMGGGEITIGGLDVENCITLTETSNYRKLLHIKSKYAIDGAVIPFKSYGNYDLTIRLLDSRDSKTIFKVVINATVIGDTTGRTNISSYLGENTLLKQYTESVGIDKDRQIEIYHVPTYGAYRIRASWSDIDGSAGVSHTLINIDGEDLIYYDFKLEAPIYLDIQADSGIISASTFSIYLGNYSQCKDLQQINY